MEEGRSVTWSRGFTSATRGADASGRRRTTTAAGARVVTGRPTRPPFAAATVPGDTASTAVSNSAARVPTRWLIVCAVAMSRCVRVRRSFIRACATSRGILFSRASRRIASACWKRQSISWLKATCVRSSPSFSRPRSPASCAFNAA